MQLCEKDCPGRYPGCSDHCEKYARNRAEYDKKMAHLKEKAFNPYCRYFTHRQILKKAKGR